MGRKKRRGVTLFELLRKDTSQPVTTAAKQTAPVTRDNGSAATQSPVVPELVVAEKPETPKPGRLQVDEDGYILHLSKQQIIGISAIAVVVLVGLLLIGGRMFRSDNPATQQQVAQTQDPDGERIQPLASLAPPAGADSTAPDSPQRLQGHTTQRAGDAAEPDQESQTEPAKPMAAAHVVGNETSAASLTQGDTRKPGLNYLVIQIIPADAKPSPQEHAVEIRKFLASRGINTLMVASGSRTMVVSEQGFDASEASYKDRCEKLMERVRQAGKEYASAKYMGRYNFASPYMDKYKK